MINLRSREDTQAFGVALAGLLRAGDLLILDGPLGAGKTALTTGIGKGLDIRGQVTSPTFVLARIHRSQTGGPDLVHVDAYRLQDLDDLETLDLDASLDDSVTVVEWGSGKAEALADSHLLITISRDEDAPTDDDPAAGTRRLVLTPVGETWSERRPQLRQLMAQFG